MLSLYHMWYHSALNDTGKTAQNNDFGGFIRCVISSRRGRYLHQQMGGVVQKNGGAVLTLTRVGTGR